MLEQYAWPGKRRELRNVIERGDDHRPGPLIEPKHLRRFWPRSRRRAAAAGGARAGTTVEEAERRLIMMTLEHTRDNKTRGRDPRHQPQDAAQQAKSCGFDQREQSSGWWL